MSSGHPGGILGGAILTWPQARSGPLDGATCLWQDLDGLHVAPAPDDPPYTSILWGWTDTGLLLRVRLDGDTVYLAHWQAAATRPTVPWRTTAARPDERILAYRGVDAIGGGLGTAYTEVTIFPDEPNATHGPITFIRPALTTGEPP